MTNTRQLNKEEKSLFQFATGELAYGLTNDYMFRAIMQENEKVLRGLIGSLKSGQDYGDIMPCLHIGIIGFDLFETENEFYSRYRLQNVKNQHIYTSKFGINVLNLRKTDQATEEDKINGLDVWAKLFKAKTWEEIRMLAETNDFVKEAATSIYAVSEDEAIRLQCEARERYERDWAGSYNSGMRDGKKEGIKEGIKEGNLYAIRNQMKNLQMTQQQAMDTLEIPAGEQAEYVSLLRSK